MTVLHSYNILLSYHYNQYIRLNNRSVTSQTVDNLPSASKIDQKKEEVIPCHICESDKGKVETILADMYCYDCDNVFCDEHSGVSL